MVHAKGHDVQNNGDPTMNGLPSSRTVLRLSLLAMAHTILPAMNLLHMNLGRPI